MFFTFAWMVSQDVSSNWPTLHCKAQLLGQSWSCIEFHRFAQPQPAVVFTMSCPNSLEVTWLTMLVLSPIRACYGVLTCLSPSTSRLTFSCIAEARGTPLATQQTFQCFQLNFLVDKSVLRHPVGVKTAPAFWAFLKKNLVFAIAKLLTCMSKILQFSRGKSSGFNIMTCKLQGFLFGKLARFSFPSQRHMRLSNMRPVFSKTFSLEFIQRHCQILMLRINLGLTWPFTLVAWLLGIADLDSFHIESTPPVWINTVLFLILFLMQKIPLEWLHASCRQPNLALKDL